MDCKIKYVQMSLKEAVKRYPWMRSLMFHGIDLNDPEYIVRIDTVTGNVEIGYASDDWNIA